MKDAIVICSYLLLLAASQPPGSAASQPSDNNTPCPPAASDDKEELISELICVENHNKERVLRRNDYWRLEASISGRDGSDCLATRCINPHELSLELLTSNSNEKVSIKVELSVDGSFDYVTTNSEPATTLSFRGILGLMPRDAVPSSCQSKSLSSLRLTNSEPRKVTITSIELKLRYPDDSYEVVYKREKHITLASFDRYEIKRSEILNNPAFISAKAGSCSDI